MPFLLTKGHGQIVHSWLLAKDVRIQDHTSLFQHSASFFDLKTFGVMTVSYFLLFLIIFHTTFCWHCI